MGIDLKIVNELWEAAKAVAEESMQLPLSYTCALQVGIALLRNKELAQKFVDEHWEKENE